MKTNYLLKELSCAMVFFFLLTGTLTAQVCGKKVDKKDIQTVKDLSGNWTGEIKSGGNVYLLQVSIKQQGEELVAQIVDASTREKLDAAVSICAPSKYHFSGVLPNGQAFRYSPWLKNGVLSGSYQVGEVCSLDKPTFNLTRKM